MDYEELVTKVNLIETKLNELERSDRYTFQKLIQILDGRNIQTGRSNGTKIGTDTDQLIGFYGTTPVDQGDAIGNASTSSVSGTGDDSTINSNFSDLESKVNSLISRLEDLGIIST